MSMLKPSRKDFDFANHCYLSASKRNSSHWGNLKAFSTTVVTSTAVRKEETSSASDVCTRSSSMGTDQTGFKLLTAAVPDCRTIQCYGHGIYLASTRDRHFTCFTTSRIVNAQCNIMLECAYNAMDVPGAACRLTQIVVTIFQTA